MINKIMSRFSSVILFAFLAGCIVGLVDIVQAQNQTQPATTDPNEVIILNSIFQTWGIRAPPGQWNTSGDLCSGAAVDSTDIDNQTYNPLIKCDCSYNNGSTCHITHLKVFALGVTGAIPDELWSLTFLNQLNLGVNYLTGNLSSAIRNLVHMQYLFFNTNAFSGNLPIELGNLTDLRALSFAENNFSGPLPYELGKLSKLKELYFSSSGVSGPIPLLFAQLQSLEILWASDNELTGVVPDIIGTWTKLTHLRLQGTSLEGPIPSSFSSLISIRELRLTDLSIGSSSSLSFIKDMKSLTILDLRNCHISDSIPPNINEYQYLTYLDLSFNNITGKIPDSIFNSSSLADLFLGNNMITGTLPLQKSSSLRNIDLSYNNLSGIFPSWINEENLHLNLVANYFTIESSNNSALSGLDCLQRNFSCNRSSGLNNTIYINCGGQQITSSNNIVFESDDEVLSPASYFVADTNRWAVTNVGNFTDTSNPLYTSSTPTEITNTLESELYQTSRISASSLRYYLWGLENGNYNVSLMFAETALPYTKTSESQGRRVFDIYIQGNRKEKDFDIRKVAGGVSFRAVQMGYNIQVWENYFEIHLLWTGKGTCCSPSQGTYGPAISAISAVLLDSNHTVADSNPTGGKNPPTGLILGIVLGVGSFLSVIAVLFIVRRRKRPHTNEDIDLIGIDCRPYIFSYDELRTATENFNPANKLGEGGFGPVYKGMLDDGREIAVKQLSVTSHQGKNQFMTEIATISAVQHRNLVKLHGCCIERDKQLLVYEYLENKSLDHALFGKRNLELNWPARFNICLGIAKGLAYLHEDSRLRIVHRDVKASNILLDSNLNPKISDFGLAKLYDENKTHLSSRVAGTLGYLAPEYAMRGHLTEKVDVFSFGVVALQTVSGRPNTGSDSEEDKIYILDWAWNLHEKNSEVELVDSRLSEFNEEEVKRVIGVALLCSQTSPTQRPPMSRVVAMLTGDIEVSAVISRPGYLTDWNFSDVTSFKSGDDSHNHPSMSSHMVANVDHYQATKSTVDDIVE